MINLFIPRATDLMVVIDSRINGAPHKLSNTIRMTATFNLDTNDQQSVNHSDFKAFLMLLCLQTNGLNLLP